MTISVAPWSMRDEKTERSVMTSSGWSPIVGSSKTNAESSCVRPISLASFSLCASPPESPGVSSPSVRYPSPSCESTSSLGRTFFISREKLSASVTSIAMSSGRDFSIPSLFAARIDSAAFEYRLPRQPGHGMSTSGRNCTSRLISPVPSHTGQRSFPVLYEKSPALKPADFEAFDRP